MGNRIVAGTRRASHIAKSGLVLPEALSVWFDGDHVASVTQVRGRSRLAYTAVALANYPRGLPLLSVMLPVAPELYPSGVVTAFLDGMLPQGCSPCAR